MVTGEIIAVEQANDAAKNLIVWVCFSKDGVEFDFYRGSELLVKDGHKVWPLYCRWENFVGQTPEYIELWVQKNIEHQAENIIKELLIKPILNEEMVKTTLPMLIGKQWNKADAEVKISDTVAINIAEDGTIR